MLSVAMFIGAGPVLRPAATSSNFWAALAGAGVGGAVSIATTYIAERQKAKSASRERDRETKANGYLASRIIRLELVETESVLRVAISRSPFQWPPTHDYALPVAAWSAYAAMLASVASTELWEQVSAVYSTYSYTNLLGQLNQESAQSLLTATEAATSALEVVHRADI
jgi:hypothetical protein